MEWEWVMGMESELTVVDWTDGEVDEGWGLGGRGED